MVLIWHPCRYHAWGIQFKEIYMVLQATLHWGDLWQEHHVIFFGDNQDVIGLLNLGTACLLHAMAVLHTISMMAVCLGFLCSRSSDLHIK
jgi:hypothetical protein